MDYLFGPSWFFGLDSVFELIAMLVTLSLSVYTFRIFRLTKSRKYIYMTLAFLSISLSYLIRGIVDWLAYTHFLGKIPDVIGAVTTVAPIESMHSFGISMHIFLMLAGFMILAAVFMGMTDFVTVIVLFVASVALTAFSQSRLIAFHLTLIVMLLLIVVHLARNYAKNRRRNALLVLAAMVFLLLSQGFFILPGPGFYIAGHVFQLLGFLSLLGNVVLVLRAS